MLWEKIHRDSKTGDIRHKDNPVVNRQCVASVAGNLIICIALLLSGCVSKTMEKSYIAGEEHKVKPPEFIGISELEFMEVTEPDAMGVSEPKSLESGRFPGGKYNPAERENPAYNRCASLKGFSERLNCANEALGLTQE